jgi:hypothetical protein
MIPVQRRGHDKVNLPLLKDIPRLFPHPGLQTGIGSYIETERIAIKIGGLPRIAHNELYMIHTA